MATIYTLKKQLTDIKAKLDKSRPEIRQILNIGCIDEPDDHEPGTEVFLIGGEKDGHYRIDEHGKKHLIKRC